MIGEGAAKAEAVATITLYRRDRAVQLSALDFAIDCIHTVRRGAPFKVFGVVDISSSEEFKVAVEC